MRFRPHCRPRFGGGLLFLEDLEILSRLAGLLLAGVNLPQYIVGLVEFGLGLDGLSQLLGGGGQAAPRHP